MYDNLGAIVKTISLKIVAATYWAHLCKLWLIFILPSCHTTPIQHKIRNLPSHEKKKDSDKK